jgi:hypothetical protein
MIFTSAIIAITEVVIAAILPFSVFAFAVAAYAASSVPEPPDAGRT